MKCTGGGPSRIVKKDLAHELILSLINVKTIQGLSNPFDSDASNKVAAKPQKTIIEYELNTERENNLEWEVIENEEAEGFDNDQVCNYEDTEDALATLSVPEVDDNTVPGVYTLPTTSKEITTFDNDLLLPNTTSIISKAEANTCKQHNPVNVLNTPTKELRKPQITPTSIAKATPNKRKRPTTVMRALTSTNIAEKYEKLVEKRLEIANMTIVEFHQKTAEHLKRMELLDLKIALKKRQLNQ